MAVGALAGMAVMTLGTYALGKICPTVTSPQQAISTSAAKSSQTYSITGSQNAVNPFGYVPLVLGKYRFAGPLGAKSWTKQVGDDQYFNMLVVWGHPDMTVTDFRIGDTPLGEFKDVTHVFHGSTTGNDLQYSASPTVKTPWGQRSSTTNPSLVLSENVILFPWTSIPRPWPTFLPAMLPPRARPLK